MKRILVMAGLAAVPLLGCSSSGSGGLAQDGGVSNGSGGANGIGNGGGSFGGSGGSSVGGSGGGPTGSGGLALAVTAASAPFQIGSSSSSSGTSFEELDVTLGNQSSATPISMSFVLFTLGTDQKLVLSSSPLSADVVPQCSASTSVASGGTYSCKLVFEVPTGQTATTLYYDDQQGHQASAAVPALPAGPTCQEAAGALVKALDGSSPACTSCVLDARSTSSPDCGAETTAANNACAGQSCDNDCIKPGTGETVDQLCSCYQSCADAPCWAASQTLLTCVAKACASSC